MKGVRCGLFMGGCNQSNSDKSSPAVRVRFCGCVYTVTPVFHVVSYVLQDTDQLPPREN